MATKYYFDRNKDQIVIVNDDTSQPLSGSDTVDVQYSHYPDELINDTDEPEIKEHLHLALVHGVLYKLLGEEHQLRMYRKLVADGRASSKNSSHMQVAQHDY